jgi:hypothetical protein
MEREHRRYDTSDRFLKAFTFKDQPAGNRKFHQTSKKFSLQTEEPKYQARRIQIFMTHIYFLLKMELMKQFQCQATIQNQKRGVSKCYLIVLQFKLESQVRDI